MEKLLINRLKLEFEDSQLVGYVYSKDEEEAEDIAHWSNKTCEISNVEDGWVSGMNYMVKWYSSEALELVMKLNETADIYGYVMYPLPLNRLEFKFKLTDENAVEPTKGHMSDSGFDLTLIKEEKRVGDVVYYNTNVQVVPPHGYYFDLVPRSSMSKSGYMIANSVGIIDQNYRGNIIVALRKVDAKAEDIKLPNRCVQLIPRQWIPMKGVKCDNVDITTRNEGGFGSTN